MIDACVTFSKEPAGITSTNPIGDLMAVGILIYLYGLETPKWYIWS